MHVQGAMPCPVSLSMDPPREHYHRSNGVIIVFHPSSDESVYVRCTSCRHGKKMNPLVSPVENASGWFTPWIRLDKCSLRDLIKEARASLLGGVRTGQSHVSPLWEGARPCAYIPPDRRASVAQGAAKASGCESAPRNPPRR